MSTTRERLTSFLDKRFTDVSEREKRLLAEFVEAEVRLALQPREQARGLAEAEAQLRIEAEDTSATVPGYRERRQAIAAELDLLRALVRSLGGEP